MIYGDVWNTSCITLGILLVTLLFLFGVYSWKNIYIATIFAVLKVTNCFCIIFYVHLEAMLFSGTQAIIQFVPKTTFDSLELLTIQNIDSTGPTQKSRSLCGIYFLRLRISHGRDAMVHCWIYLVSNYYCFI